ncbi:MAG: bifunctional 4-hydroxy-2-oxoglutarate aldolase/2-dehydro-3-deoxy-phosphogluconate aldolase [Pseudomonadales bacterium]|jgi:2-dehydro-3-deoxyphosphogluconate aldolase/(4S)-4-hydroxy-2-oxoglutarate aldolase|nr:bifunctional 4-hydroxy-2-oxoglutarate aldolase/2-dehydro-3-deoxy-phosphogluconate aldolase [Pseudomonadales bacterium]
MSKNIHDIMHKAPVIPVLTIDKLDSALPLAQALLEGGLPVLEITLRTQAALEAIKIIKAAFPQAITGAGTVIDTRTLDQALAAGADFIVSPGATPTLLRAAIDSGVPLLPGVASPSEVMQAFEYGLHALKFFPAEAAGGINMLKALAAPLPQAVFCPTGGITGRNASYYLALPNVACVGGSWMATKALIDQADWPTIRGLAHAAAALR